MSKAMDRFTLDEIADLIARRVLALRQGGKQPTAQAALIDLAESIESMQRARHCPYCGKPNDGNAGDFYHEGRCREEKTGVAFYAGD